MCYFIFWTSPSRCRRLWELKGQCSAVRHHFTVGHWMAAMLDICRAWALFPGAQLSRNLSQPDSWAHVNIVCCHKWHAFFGPCGSFLVFGKSFFSSADNIYFRMEILSVNDQWYLDPPGQKKKKTVEVTCQSWGRWSIKGELAALKQNIFFAWWKVCIPLSIHVAARKQQYPTESYHLIWCGMFPT